MGDTLTSVLNSMTILHINYISFQWRYVYVYMQIMWLKAQPGRKHNHGKEFLLAFGVPFSGDGICDFSRTRWFSGEKGFHITIDSLYGEICIVLCLKRFFIYIFIIYHTAVINKMSSLYRRWYFLSNSFVISTKLQSCFLFLINNKWT